MCSNPSHISSASNLSISVIRIIGYCIFAFPVHTSDWVIPQCHSERSAEWRVQLGLNAVPGESWSQVEVGHCRQRPWIASIVCCIIFLLFLFLGTCFHSMTVIKIACKWGHTSICNKYSNKGSQRHKLDFVATGGQDVITKLNHICISQGTSFSCL